jgi:hypothetical protein
MKTNFRTRQLGRMLGGNARGTPRRKAYWFSILNLMLLLISSMGVRSTCAQVCFFDSVFAPADWDISFFAHPQPPSGGLASQGLGPAPRLYFQQIEHTLGGATPSEVLSLHMNRQAIYHPKQQCPIAFIDYSELSRTLSTEPGTFGGGAAPALRQDGNFYVADFAPTRTDVNGSLPSPFITNSFSGLTSNGFRLVLGPGRYDNSRHPNFSRSGSPLQFGFARVNSHTGSSTITRATAIDDWNVCVFQNGMSAADFGDAPDGLLGMSTGYYGFTSLNGIVFTVASISGPAFFPTVLANSGPFTVSGDLYVAPLPPSLESDAIGLVDSDPIFNLDPVADDADNDFAEPGASMLLLFGVASRPPARFFTLAASTANGPTAGFWNVAFDMDQDGEWGPGEWVCEDIPFTVTPGNPGPPTLLASPAFRWGPVGQQFGRLTFPVWARNMVTSEAVSTNTPLAGPPGQQYYAGAGPACGFTYGEVEDLFLEWFPIGQFNGSNDPPREMSFGPDVPADHLIRFNGPEVVAVGQRAEFVISGPPLEKLTVTYLPNADSGGAAGPQFDVSLAGSRSGSIETSDFIAEAELTSTGDRLVVTVHQAPRNATLVVHGRPADRGIIGPGVPSGPNRTPIFGAVAIRVEAVIRITEIQVVDGHTLLKWAGGAPPYRVQHASRLGGDWINVVSTEAAMARIPLSGQAGFFRVVGEDR